MFSRKDLLKSKEYWLTNIQAKLFSLVDKYLTKEGLSRKEFADKLGFSKGYISQVLNGNCDHRISKIIELSLATGKVPQIYFEDIDQVLEDDELGLLNEDNVTERPIIKLEVGYTPKDQTIDSSKKKRMKKDKTDIEENNFSYLDKNFEQSSDPKLIN